MSPDVVMDLICYTLDSAQHLVEALRGRVQHFLHCGTIWVHGPSIEVPVTEEQPRRPFGDLRNPQSGDRSLAVARSPSHWFSGDGFAPGTSGRAGLGAIEPRRQCLPAGD